MREARAVVEGEGWRGPRCLRREDGDCGGFVVGWVGGGCCGESGAESRVDEIWAWAETRAWPVGV